MSENAEAAAVLNGIADLLDLAGEKFKPEAYRRAARSIESLPEPLRRVAARGGLGEIPGVGEAIEEKLKEFLRDHHISYYDRLRQEFPAGLIELMQLPNIGPKTARRFWTELGIEGPQGLATAIEAGRLNNVKGFGAKKIELFQLAAGRVGGVGRRLSLLEAFPVVEEILAAMRAGEGIERIEAAGSFRRCRETVGDIDILATTSTPEIVLRRFQELSGVEAVKLAGGTKVTIAYRGGLQVDLRVVEPSAFGAALQYFTGSKDHNIRLRSIARDSGLKINEYGVFRGETRIAGATEEEVYATMKLPWIPPEIRENQGEIEAARGRALPTLIERDDIRGLLHYHLPKNASAESLERLCSQAGQLRWEYVGIVVSELHDGVRTSVVASSVRERIVELREASGGGPRLLAIEETDGPSRATRGRRASAVDLTVVDARAASNDTVSRNSSTSPVMIVHAVASGQRDNFHAAARRAREQECALEIVPEGLDTSALKQFLSEGGSVALGPGGDDPVDLTRWTIVVGLARRAWCTAPSVLNARRYPPLPGPSRS